MIISRFGEKPKTKRSWWALYLGLAALILPPVLGLVSSLFRFVVDRTSYDQMPAAGNPVGGIGGVFLALVLSAWAAVTAIQAFRAGERSWVMWVGLVLALAIALFWVVVIAAEFIVPH